MVAQIMHRPLLGFGHSFALFAFIAFIVGILGYFGHIISPCSGIVQYHAVGYHAESGGIGSFFFIYHIHILPGLLFVALQQPGMRQREECANLVVFKNRGMLIVI